MLHFTQPLANTDGRVVRVVRADGTATDVLVPSSQPAEAAVHILRQHEHTHGRSTLHFLPPTARATERAVPYPPSRQAITTTTAQPLADQTAEIARLRARVAELENEVPDACIRLVGTWPGLALRGRGESVHWCDASDAVTPEAQNEYTEYIKGVVGGSGWVGDAERLAGKSITVADVRAYPEDLLATTEAVEWAPYLSSLRVHMPVDAVPHLPPSQRPALTAVSDERQAQWIGQREKLLSMTSRRPGGKEFESNATIPRSGHVDESLVEYQQAMWESNNGPELEPMLASGAIALLDAHWLIAYYEQGGRRLGRRQDLPPEAFMSLGELKAAGTPSFGLPCILLSYMWLQPDHPDPHGDTLRSLVSVLKLYTCRSPETSTSYGNSTLGPGGTQRWGVFIDYVSMHQHKSQSTRRAASEDELFRTALNSLDRLYSHPRLTVLRMTKKPAGYPTNYDVPKGANVAEYMDRGWPFLETCLAHLCKGREKVLDLSKLSGDERWPYQLVQKAASEGTRLPPLTPEDFDEQIGPKTFTNEKDDHPLCKRLYRQAFYDRLGKITLLKMNSLRWGDADGEQLAKVIRTGVLSQVRVFSLHTNRFGGRALQHLAAAMTVDTVPNLRHLKLGGNPFGDEGAIALASTIGASQTPLLERLDVRNSDIGQDGLAALAASFRRDTTPNLREAITHKNKADDEIVKSALLALSDVA